MASYKKLVYDANRKIMGYILMVDGKIMDILIGGKKFKRDELEEDKK